MLTKGFTAPEYEKAISNFETKGQLLSYYSGGIKLPRFIIEDLIEQENKSVQIRFLDLRKVYTKKEIDETKIKDFYEKNKEFFKDKFRTFRYLKLPPEALIGKSDLNEEYFKKIDDIENDILDGKSFEEITSFNKNNIIKIESINSKRFKKDGNKFAINEKLLNEIFKNQNFNIPIFITIENEFYIAEILNEEDIILSANNKNVRETIKNQIQIVNLIEKNTEIIKKINDNKFGEKEMLELSQKHNVQIEKAKINNIKDESKFSNVLLKQIYNYNAGQTFLVTDFPISKKNFLVKIDKEIPPVFNKDNEIYKE